MKNILTIGLLSDTHLSLSESGQRNKKRFEASLDGIKKFSPDVRAVMICGDLCDWDCLSDILVTREALEARPWLKEVELLVTPGNHDAWCASAEGHPGYAGKTVFRDYNIFNDFLKPFVYRDHTLTDGEELVKGYYHTRINGVNILSVVGYDGHHGAEAISWLKSKLDLIRETEKSVPCVRLPVIIMTHVLPTKTVVSTYGEASRWHSGTIKELLVNYPEALLFAGHTHVPLDDDRTFWQGEFTVISNGSLHTDIAAAKPGYGILEIKSDGEMRYHRLMLESDPKALGSICFTLPGKREGSPCPR